MMRRSRQSLPAAFALLIATILPGLTHPDLIEQIVSTTRELEQHGDSAELYLTRADLFRRHGQFDAALTDLSTAERCQTNTVRLRLERARVLSDAGQATNALAEIEPFLQTTPNHAEALLLRARSHARLGQPAAAVADFDSAINNAVAPGPDMFLERARQQAVQGKFAAAVRGLDQAITNFATFPPLQLAAIDYDRQQGAFDDALARAETFLARYPVKEPWLTLKAEIQEQAGRTSAAAQTFQQVLDGLGAYPPVRRTLDLTQQLESRARAGLARTQPAPAANP